MIKDEVNGELLTMGSPLTQFIYDAQFSYVDGKLDEPNMGAGSALLTIIRMAFTWKGAVLWKMQGGMGDVVFTPLYLALKDLGVKFEFFHKVENLGLSSDKKSVLNITGLKQLELKDPSKAYDPFVWVKGLQCWPSEPNWDQLNNPHNLTPADLESYCCQKGDPFKLEKGTDFDEIIFGIPVAGIPYVASEIVESHLPWKNMVDHLKTVRTQAFQAWFDVPKSVLETPGEGQALMVTYHASLNTVSDMTFLIEHEGWDPEDNPYPSALYYTCGPMFDPHPPHSSPSGPKQSCEEMDQTKLTKRPIRMLRS